MKYLSIDIEATGLAEDDLIIEFAAIGLCTEKKEIVQETAFHSYVQCPPFEKLKPRLAPWVVEHNKELIEKAHEQGRSLKDFKEAFTEYLESQTLKDFFRLKDDDKIILFGKSLNAIDLPFLNRDLGFEYMRKYFSHRTIDLSSIAYYLVDSQEIPPECLSGSGLMEYLQLGKVCHTALEDAVHTAQMYLKLL